MAASDIPGLKRRMELAAAAGDFETAAALRDALQAAKSAAEAGSATRLRRQVPGAMGLGTDQPALRPPDGWTRPKKPDLLTSKTRPRRGGRK